jgi:hypothetical protein
MAKITCTSYRALRKRHPLRPLSRPSPRRPTRSVAFRAVIRQSEYLELEVAL